MVEEKESKGVIHGVGQGRRRKRRRMSIGMENRRGKKRINTWRRTGRRRKK